MRTRNASDVVNNTKGYATEVNALRRITEVLDAAADLPTPPVFIVVRNNRDRWVPVMIYNPNNHHVHMFLARKGIPSIGG